MNRIRFLWDNKFDKATISASSEVEGLPVSNLKDQLRKKVWRATGCASEYVDVDFGEGGDYCNTLALVQHNLSISAQVRLCVSDIEPGGNELLDVTWEAYETVFGAGEGGAGEEGSGGYIINDQERKELLAGMIFCKEFTQTAGRYWRIYFLDENNTDGYVEAGRIWLGTYFEPQFNFQYGWQFGIVDRSRVTESIGGQKWVDKKDRRYTLYLPFRYIQDTDKWWGFVDMLRRYGVRKDILVVLIPDGTPSQKLFTTLYGRFRNLPNLREWMYGLTSTILQFEESL